MPTLDLRALGEWIQIAASVGVIAGIALAIIGLAVTRAWIEPETTDATLEAGSAIRREDHHGAQVTVDRQAELRRFVDQNCPPCHAMTAGLGPALSTTHLEQLSVNAVASTILYGRPAKGMPPWQAQLSQRDAYWVAEYLKRGGFTH
jgi:mono/diheme cytochrome c family protein